MARDYKYRASPRRKKKSAPAWLWMLVGLLVGAFVMGLVWLKLDSSQENGDEWVGAKPDRQPQRVEPKKPVVDVPPHKPRFEFYDKLGRQEVLVPDDQLDLRSEVEKTARYEVQVGSFVKSSDAERLKAELALLGIETRVAEARIAAGKVRYRVIAGPFLGRSALDKVRSQLKSNGHLELLVRVVR
jgi:cell division protein FtsN